MTDLQIVTIDIETTGLGPADALTVVGFRLPMGCRVFVQTDGRGADSVPAAVGDRAPEPVQVSTHPDEHALVEAVAGFTAERLQGREVLLVGYNADTYRGGFDLPFLRTRLAALEHPWLFRDVPYADLLPVLTRRFNLGVGDETATDLDGAYELLCDGAYAGVDPFADSDEAVTAFETGAFTELVLHNVADLLRTQAVGRVAKRYCSRSEFQLKSLTPAVEAGRRDRPPPDPDRA